MEDKNIIQFPKLKKLNMGILAFFVLIIFYLCGIMYSYFTSKHIVSYQVLNSSLSTDSTFTGIALREETVYTASRSGYLNYYARESSKVGYGNLIYSIDPDGSVNELINSNLTDNQSSLTDEELSFLKSEITGYVSNFDAASFADTYQLKYTIQNDISKILSDSLSANLQSTGNVYFAYTNAPGYVVYSVDGYEDLTVEQITEDIISQRDYDNQNLLMGEEIAAGDPAYKLCTSEKWSIVIECSEAYADKLVEEEYVQVKFEKNQNISWGQVTKYNNPDGKTYVSLTFTNSVVAFCTERFIDIEIILDKENGLKIPNTSIVEKEFFLIPEQYVMKGANSTSSYMVNRLTYDSKGNRITETFEISIYNYDAENKLYYVDDSILRKDDILCAESTMTDTYVVGKTGTLIGVYNINKGYADFKQIIILSQNDEYSIVQSNTDYGLSMYDYIVLDAKVVNENDFIYK